MNAPRVAYDARFSLGNYRGMGRYLRTLIAGREHSLTGFCATGEHDDRLRLVGDGMRAYPLWEQVSLPRLVREHDVDIFIAPYNTAPLQLPSGTRLVLIVHDLIYLDPLPLSDSLYQNVGRLYRRLVMPRAIERADLVVTVSHTTASRIVSQFGIDRSSLRVIPNSIGAEWYSNYAPNHGWSGLVLAVSGEAPSKNLRRALEAFALCRERIGAREVQMKIAGVRPAFHPVYEAEAQALGIGDAVEFLPYLADDALRRLYREADVLLMPSLAEGFGIPVLEAMASGVPVACSNAGSLPEVGGVAASYFDPVNVEQMAEVLHHVLSDAGLRARMRRAGRLQSMRFHPQATRCSIDSLWERLGQPKIKRQTTEFASC